MHRCLAFFAILTGIFASCSFAQSLADDHDLTADELAVNASSLFAQGRYAEAAESYRKFAAEFGSNAEAQATLRQMRYPLAMCLLRLQRFSEAHEAIKQGLASDPSLDSAQSQDLLFWRGICEMQEGHGGQARATLEKFIGLLGAGSERNAAYVRQFPAAQKVPEARLLVGACLLLEGKSKEAADYYARLKQELASMNRGRAAVSQLHALLESGDVNEAMNVVLEEFPRMGDLLQLVSFQTLTFELGTRYLEKNEARKTIMCLQRVWRADRLLKHQQGRLEDLESRLQAVEADPRGDPYTRLLYGQMIAKVRREIENFRKIESFDAAVRLRLAAAYQAMNRYRESALVLEPLLNEMPAGQIVESASLNLVQCWSALENWSKVSAAGKAFLEKFSRSESVPLIRYMMGIAEQRSGRYSEAMGVFDTIGREHQASDYAPRAAFMKAFCLLQAERSQEAIAEFEQFASRYPRHELAPDALYWRGIGLSLEREFGRCRLVMDEYLQRYRSGRYRESAEFRKAYCAQQAKDYQTSIAELDSFLRNHPEAAEANEARILLGDALLTQGRAEEGIAAYQGIPPQDAKLYAEGVFKIGKALKRLEDYEKLRAHMDSFKTNNPRHPRVAEAIYWIGWTHRQQGMPAKAREVYWQAIRDCGDDAAIWSVDELFPALLRLYKGEEEQTAYLAQLERCHEEAERTARRTLATRVLWARAAALKAKDPARATRELVEVSERLNVQTANPLVLADCADALLTAGKQEAAQRMFRDLLKWNPRAPQKDRALAALGRSERERGNTAGAIEFFERFEREVTGSRLVGQVLLAKAELLGDAGRTREARATLEKLLACEDSLGQEKARALYAIGEIHMEEARPELAISYFQRLYVMHGRWRDWVAKAYYRSGEAFERLNDPASARRTYQELAGREDLAGFEEARRAAERLHDLGGPTPAGNEANPAKG